MKQRSLRAAIMAVAMTAGLVAAAVPAWADLDAGVGSIVKAPTTDTDGDSTNGTSSTEDDDTNDGGTKNNVSANDDNAHPSGKDRSVESGGSGNQGNAGSDPDDDGRGPDRSNGGPDKPNGSGGDDLADQDGNNGCGNDDDFEDDNEGWCGGKPKPTNDESCARGKGHGWECNPGGTLASGGGSSTCPNKHMGGDDNGGGANQSGAYDSTCDGSPSGNGNGTGGRGKPCAGCVGNADDKNPPGQLPDGSDANKGYECDENSGVGKTNPAHSGCMPEAAANADVLGRTDYVCPAGTANAGETMTNPKDCDDSSVLGTIVRRAGPLGVAGKKVASAVGAALPFTGVGDLVAFLALAALLLAAGMTMLRKKNEVGTEA